MLRWQELRRGRYVEFNLMYDKGTTYGLKNPSARVESILASLPPAVKFEYPLTVPGPEESKLLAVLQNPRDWV